MLDPKSLPPQMIASIKLEAEILFQNRTDMSGEKILRGYKAGFVDGFKRALELFNQAVKETAKDDE